ncbi:MAG: hypothetical protein KC493_18000 [Bacteriovoracaceae bacterium]|nr:hypothetical protein [Bacteriovoracaceae bacterium]
MSMDKAFNAIAQNSLGYQLTPISIRELLYIDSAPETIYGLENGLYRPLIAANKKINKDILKQLISAGHVRLFVDRKKRHLLIDMIQEKLTKVTRSLSIGDPVENGRSQMNLLTVHFEYVYGNITDDDILNKHFQFSKNLCSFLLANSEKLEKLYLEYRKQKHHFIFSQPLLASLLLLGVLKNTRVFSAKEMELLFLTSYFKDIGMSSIPVEKYDDENLSKEDKKRLVNHAETSVEILEGRVPLSPSHMEIIKNHHAFSLLNKELNHDIEIDTPQGDDNIDRPVLVGSETVLICSMDIIAAMVTPRPWREAENLFKVLDLVRVLISDDFSGEFKTIVSYFKNFKKK